MKLNKLQPTKLSASVDRIYKASGRLATQVQSSIEDFTANHTERFAEAGEVGGTLLIVSAMAKDAVNTLTIAQDLTDEESVTIHGAVTAIMTGTSLADATDGFPAKLALLTQSFILAYQIGNLDEATHANPAGFNVTVNADNSVTTSDFEE